MKNVLLTPPPHRPAANSLSLIHIFGIGKEVAGGSSIINAGTIALIGQLNGRGLLVAVGILPGNGVVDGLADVVGGQAVQIGTGFVCSGSGVNTL